MEGSHNNMLNLRETKKKRVITLVVVILVLIAMVGVPIISAIISVI